MKGKRILALLCAVATVLQLALIGGPAAAPAAKAAEAVGTTTETFYYDLADGSYLITGGGQNPGTSGTSLTVNGAAVANGHTLSAPGDYTIVNKYQDRSGNWVELTQQIVLYQRGDAHPDGVFNIKDLVAMKKCEQGLPLSTKAGAMAVEGYLGKIEAGVMQTFLLSDRGVAAQIEAFPEAKNLTFNGGSQNVMPIGGYEGPADKANADTTGYSAAVKDYLTDQYYSVLQGAGINLILSAGHATATPESTTQKQLSLAQKYGMRVFVGPSYLFSNGTSNVTDELLLQLLREYSGYSSMAGFTLQDEPDGTGYPSANYQDSTKNGAASAALAKLIAKYPNLTGFTNLFPWWSSLGTMDAYKAYLEEYFKNYGAGADHLSFDYYVFAQGIQTGGRTRKEYFDNLEMVKEAADKHNVPFWSTIQVGNYVTGEEKKNDWLSNLLGNSEKDYMTQGLTSWNVNTSLAYGAKGITYYPLIQPYSYAAVNSGQPNYGRSGIIGANGQTNEDYLTYVANANKQIMAVDEVLMNATHKGFLSTGTASTESGVANIAGNALTEVSSNKSMGAFVGCFDYYGQNAYYVVNYDHDNAANITLTFDKAYSLRVTIDGTTSSEDAAATHTLNLAAGNAALVLLGDAAATGVAGVESRIDAIPEAPSTSGYYAAVVAARAAYSALPQADRALLPAATLDKYNHHNENTRSYEAFQAMLNALPDVCDIALIEKVDKARTDYTALAKWSKLLTEAEQKKFDNLVKSRLSINILINVALDKIDNPSASTGYSVGTAVDPDYGAVFTLTFENTNQAGFRLEGNLSGYTNRHFYVYNPTQAAVSAWVCNNDWSELAVTANGITSNHLTMQPGWNKVDIPDDAVITKNFLAQFNGTEGMWMISAVYSITSDAQAEIEAAPVIALIDALPGSVDEITAENYTDYEAKLTEINTKYAALSPLAQSKVVLTKVTACQARVDAIKDALGAAGEVNSLLTALPAAKDVTFKDLAAVNAAKAAFDKLDDTAQAQVSADLKTNLDACVAALDGFTLLIDATTAHFDDPYGKATAVGKATDETYGPVVTITYNTAETTGFALYGDLTIVTGANQFFYVYNPTQVRVGAWMYYVGADGQKQLPMTTGENPNLQWLEPGWTKVELPSGVAITKSIIAQIGGTTGTWKISSVYAATDAALLKQEARPVNNMIADLPEAAAVQLTDKAQIEAARAAYTALSDAAKAKVENLAKLQACEEKIVALVKEQAITNVNSLIDALPEAAQITMPGSIKWVKPITAAKAAYDALGENSSGVDDTRTAKLNGCVEKIAGYSVVFDAETDSTAMDATTGTATITPAVDDTYGDVFKADITANDAENSSYGAQLQITKTGALQGVDNVIFYIYNPTQTTYLEVYTDGAFSGWYAAGNGWTKIIVNTANKSDQIRISLPQGSVGEWKITNIFAAPQALVDAEAAAKVDAQIEALKSADSLEIGDKNAVTAAKEAYEALSVAAKALVKSGNKDKLEACVAKIAELETPADKVTPVKEAIAALPDADKIGGSDREAIAAAEAAYKALTSEQQAKVTNAQKLTDCLAKVAEWDAWNAKVIENAALVKIEEDATISAAKDDNTFGSAFSISNATGFKLPKSALVSEGGAVEFSIYKPAGVSGTLNCYIDTVWGSNPVIFTLEDGWNRILVEDKGAEDWQKLFSKQLDLYFYAAINVEGWMITNIYAATQETEIDPEAEAVAAVNAQIAALPDADKIGGSNREAIAAAEEAYEALTSEQQTKVTNVQKLNACVAKVAYWDKLAGLTVMDIAATGTATGNEKVEPKEHFTTTKDVDDNMFGKVTTIDKDASYLALVPNDAYKACKNVGFYIYNPTDNAVTGHYTLDWGYKVYFLLRSKAWNYIELADVGTTDNQKFITSGTTVYFYADFVGGGWRISNIYRVPEAAAGVAGAAVVLDAGTTAMASQIKVGEPNNWANVTVNSGVEDATFGKVMEITNTAGVLGYTSGLMTNAYKSSRSVVFYIFNPTSNDVTGYYTNDDWAYNVNFLLKANSWNRIYISDFGTETGKHMISSGKSLWIYANYSGTGWKVSSAYSLPEPGAN